MRQYQFIQNERDLLELWVVPDEAFGPPSEAALRAALAPIVPGVTVRIRPVAAIPPEAGGKHRIVQSRVEPRRRDGRQPRRSLKSRGGTRTVPCGAATTSRYSIEK